jgi:putative two-component system response regulator
MSAESAEKKAKILVVDDIADNIEILFNTLQQDYAVVAAKDGVKALRIAARKPHPDLILLDIMMPNMDGYETCRQLKADPELKHIPVIFLTAMDDLEDERRGLALGAVDYLTKPFRPDLVAARVANHIELKRYRDGLEGLVEARTAELSRTQEATLLTLSNLIESRDPETGGHIQRTRSYIKLLAEKLRHHPRFSQQLDDETIELLYNSAPLHDIGKVAISDAVLNKPGKLNADEFTEMKQHPLYGHKALQEALKRLGEHSFLRYGAEIAYTHHERWDGSGYPCGTRGEQIPLSGRLMALADVYDALISKRAYKPPFSHAKAVEIIREGRGKHFDPDIVDAFLEIHEEFRQTALRFADCPEERENLRDVAG